MINNTVNGLSKLLAESYTLYLKTQNYHWNVTGPHFSSLHDLFMKQYSELALAIDELAERIRTLGAVAPGSFVEYQNLSSIELKAGVPKSTEMVRALLNDQLIIVNTAQTLFESVQAAKDEATYDLLVQRVQVHQKNAWMLQSTLEA
jgi:starvation-inducible DNA-binding protein